ncbi:MAG: alpha-2-macroglobulin family protein, partial [Leadbetterella sp.]
DQKFENQVTDGITDAAGTAKIPVVLPDNMANNGLLEGKAIVSVFDETGRPVHRQKVFDIHTQKHYFGLKIPTYFTGTSLPFAFEAVALDNLSKLATTQATLQYVLLEYQTVLEKTDQGLRYVSKQKEKIIKEEPLNFASQKIKGSFTPKISGEYEIRILPADKSQGVSVNFYAYGYGGMTSFEVDTDGEIQIETNVDTLKTGQELKTIFKTPFDGKLIVTIETNGVLETQFLETKDKSAILDFKITKEHLPNVYITATLVRPMNNPEMPLMSAHGIKSVIVNDPDRKIPIKITALNQVRSVSKQTVEVQTSPNTELTIAVVDEGILQLKNTQTPDLGKFFYQKRALEINAYDMYPLLLPEIMLNNRKSTGGDGSMGKRINPLANGRAELVAKWSGIIHSDGSGKAKFEFDIPEFLGALRIMVVAYKDESFGSAEQTMKVSDPVSISVGMPLFMSPNDKAAVPVTFFNTTDKVQNVTLKTETQGVITTEGFAVTTLQIPAKSEKNAELIIKAKNEIGVSKLKVLAISGTETFGKTTEIAVRPSGSLQKSAESGVITAAKDVVLKAPAGLFMPGTVSSKVYIGNVPSMQFGHILNNLLDYPHGCMEQTISKAFPQLYFEDLVDNVSNNVKGIEGGKSERNPKYNITAAIERIEVNQSQSGGVFYWPGETAENWFVSAYSLHFLLEAQKAGFEVNPRVIQTLTYFLNAKCAEEHKMETIFYRVNNVVKSRNRMLFENVYSAYVLSLSDDPNVSVMNGLKDKISTLSNDEQFLLACAYKQIGDDATFAKIIPRGFVNEVYDRMHHGSFSSPIRSIALVLNALIETQPNHMQVAILSKQLSGILSNKNQWLSTQEQAFGLMAMGKILRKADPNASVNILVDGKVTKTIKGKGEWIDLSSYPQGVTLKSTQAGMYYYWETEGVKADNKYVAEDKSLKVRRTYYTRDGIMFKSPNFKSNQLIVVKLSLSTVGLTYTVNNVALTDMLPAGIEIENPRLVEDRNMPWIKDASMPTYLDIRDDRITYFVDADPKEKHYYYIARAVGKGSFERGPVSADAMYDANIRSYWGGGKIAIE